MEFRVVGMVLGEALHMLGGGPALAALFKDIGRAMHKVAFAFACLQGLVAHQHGDAVAAGGVLCGELERWGELVCH